MAVNSVEGAMFQGKFLPEEEFIKAVISLLEDNSIKTSLKTHLINVMQAIKTGIPKKAYICYENFYTEFLHNPKVQLLAITNFSEGSGAQETWQLMDEAQTIAPDTKGTINVTRNKIKTYYYSSLLSEHLSQYFKVVNRKRNDIEESLAKKYHKSTTVNTLRDLIWTKAEQEANDFKVRGQIADAFLQHLGKYHLSFLESNEDPAKSFKNNTIFEKEGGTKGMAKSLYEAKNGTGWYAGGDLIVTNKNGEVIANIQLKTSKDQGKSIGAISTTFLENSIKKILLGLENSTQVAAKGLYEMLKASAIPTNIENKVDNVIENLLSSVSSTIITIK